MRRFAGITVITGLIVLCLYTARLHGRVLGAGKRVEDAIHQAIVLHEEIENTRSKTDRSISVPRLAEMVADLRSRTRDVVAQLAGRSSRP